MQKYVEEALSLFFLPPFRAPPPSDFPLSSTQRSDIVWPPAQYMYILFESHILIF